LFRTELLYLDRPELPSEDEQFQDAVTVLTALGGRPATFRTLDIGGEKLPLGVAVPGGTNPTLGLRAIRFALRRPDIFRTQLRALYRASALGPLRIMFPLVSGISELDEAQRVCAEVAEELAGEGVAFDRKLPIGVMIETPSAALTTDHLAGSASFFSIGTNDLMQYTFAADRENEDVAHLYHPLHPAFLRLLKSAIDAANGAGKPISICGDMAGDPAFTWVLLGLGLRSLSMSPRLIPAVRSVISSSGLDEMEALAARALSLRSETAVEDLVLGVMRERFPLELANS
jgi:phosphotransferase system enzyme I (PtsI)